MKRLLALVLLGGCASPSAAGNEPAPPVVTAVPPPESATTPTEPTPKALAAEPSSLDDQVQRFVDAANAGDLGATQSLSTPRCWDDECGSFARQAQKKFKVQRTGEPKIAGSRAIADADIVCDGERKCDFVHFLFQLEAEVWIVADIVEDDDEAEAWLARTH